MGLYETKPVFRVFEKARLKPNQSPQLHRLARNFAWSKSRYDTFQQVNNKGADQTARMRRLVCNSVVHKPPQTGFLTPRPIYRWIGTLEKNCGLTMP